MKGFIGVLDLGDGMRFTQEEVAEMDTSELKDLISLCDVSQAKRVASWTDNQGIKDHVSNIIDNINRPSRF